MCYKYKIYTEKIRKKEHKRPYSSFIECWIHIEMIIFGIYYVNPSMCQFINICNTHLIYDALFAYKGA